MTRQRRWQLERIRAGECTRCGAARGDDGLADLCRGCGDKRNATKRALYARRRAA